MAIGVLIVDDTESLRDLLRLHIEQTQDMDVVGEAADGLEAVSVARSTQPDAIILDVEMPVMDGLQALAGLREAAPHARIIVFSSRLESTTQARALAAGVDGYFRKGEAKSSEVVAHIRQLFSGEATARDY